VKEIISSPYFVAALFFLIAFVCSSVGLGGASFYSASMVILGFNILAIPMVSLLLNLVVSTTANFNFIRNKHTKLTIIFPFLITSIPMSYLGGSLQLSPKIFYWVLLISLSFVAMRFYFWKSPSLKKDIGKNAKLLISLFSGSIFGLIAGIAGIGGGIYMVPLIIILGLGSAKEAAAGGAVLVWLNSMAGLIPRLQHNTVELTAHLPLIFAVLIGGFLGSYLGSSKYSARTMQKTLGIIILVAMVFLIKKILNF